MKARSDIFSRCRGCGRRLKRKSTVCSRICAEIASSTDKSLQQAPLLAKAREEQLLRKAGFTQLAHYVAGGASR